MAWRMSSGSKPAVTSGLPYSWVTNRYGWLPTTVDTWPGPRKPSRRRSGESRIALIGGTIVTWLENTLKFMTRSSRALTSVTAVEGAVVSKPTAKNTTSRSGLSTATFSASSGEYTNRTSAPRALASSSVPLPPGTRIMSPKLVKMTFGVSATAMASSMRPIGITHTGQPGPCTSSTLRGQHVLDAVAVDGVGVAAAHLHELVVALGVGQLRIVGQHAARGDRVAVLVDEPHGAVPRSISISSSRPEPMSLSDASATAASSSSIFDMAKPDVDEHPVAGLEHLVLEQADVDHAAHAGHLDARELIVVRSQLDELTGDAEAHGGLLAGRWTGHMRRRRRYREMSGSDDEQARSRAISTATTTRARNTVPSTSMGHISLSLRYRRTSGAISRATATAAPTRTASRTRRRSMGRSFLR